MKKILFLFVMLLSAMTMFAQPSQKELADPKPGPQEAWSALKQVTLGWGSTDVRYSRSQPATSTPKLMLHAWRGERVSAQAVLSTPVSLKNVSFTVSDLKSGKNVIAAENVRRYFVRYVITDVFMKDSLLVADNLDPVSNLAVDANTTRPMWLDVRVPADAKPGTYKGTLTVNADGKELTLPLQLQVSKHVLPPPSEWAFHLDLWQNPYAVARFFNVPLWSKAHFDLMRPLMKQYAEAGGKVITTSIIQHPWNSQTYDPFESMIAKMKQLDGTWKYDYTVFDRWVEFMMECGVTEQIDCYTLVPWHYIFDYYDCATNSTKTVACKPAEAAYRDLILPFLRDFAAHLKAKGWWERTCIAMDERPMDQLQAAWDVVMEADKGYRIKGAANYEMNTKGIGDKMYDLSIKYEHSQIPDDVIEGRHAKGQKLTFYTCCSPQRPNTFTCSDPAESAFLGWHAMACKYDGYLRWAFNSWPANPCQDSRFGNWTAGDTYMVYPYGSTIRMERLVEGIQAYEKIRILRPTLTPAQQKQLDAILVPFSVNKYDASVKAADVVNAGKAFLQKISK